MRQTYRIRQYPLFKLVIAGLLIAMAWILLALPGFAHVEMDNSQIDPTTLMAETLDHGHEPGYLNVLASASQTNDEINLFADRGQVLAVKRQFTLEQPKRLVIDLADTVLADKNMAVSSNGPTQLIQNVRVGQFDEETVRIVVETPQPEHFSFRSVNGDQSHLALFYGHQPIKLEAEGFQDVAFHSVTLPKGLRVMIDPGHGGKDWGANRAGVIEKSLNLKVAHKVRKELEAKGIKVYMTRWTDRFVPLPSIAASTNKIRPDLFISLHTNASTNTAPNGIETFYYTPQSRVLAAQVQQRMISNIKATDRKVKRAPFYVIKRTQVPAILVETGFLSNPTERTLLNTDERQTAAAKAIVEGIVKYIQSRMMAKAG